MELKAADLRWLRALAVELRGALKESRGPRVFVDAEWVGEVVTGLQAITKSKEKEK